MTIGAKAIFGTEVLKFGLGPWCQDRRLMMPMALGTKEISIAGA